MTPTARTLAECRKRGWPAENVEQTIKAGPRTFKRDLAGCIDILVYLPGETIGIQACAGASHAARKAKILATPRAMQWLSSEARRRIVVWSWAKKGARGKRKTWQLREEEIQ